jgi:hypothetical protein
VASPSSTLISYNDRKLDRQALALVPAPPSTATHQVIPHHEVINALVETLGFRHISAKLFGIMELETTFNGCRFALGIRNSHDKSMRLAMTVGYRVFVCENLSFVGDFQPVLAKHSKNFRLLDSLSVGVDQCQRNFKPMVEAVERWRDTQLSDVSAKLLIYEAFIEGAADLPRHLAKDVHNYYFQPPHEDFAPRTLWSLQNSFTGAIKQLEAIPSYKATANLARFFEDRKL